MSACILGPPVRLSKQVNFWRLGEETGDWERSTVQYSTVQYSIVQYSTVQYDVKNVMEGREGEGRREGPGSVFLLDLGSRHIA